MTAIGELYQLEHDSIVRFLRRNREHLRGRVLDLGAGKRPYRRLVEDAGGTYVPYDSNKFPGTLAVEESSPEVLAEEYDAVICTQVLQYLDPAAPYYEPNNPMTFIHRAAAMLAPGSGALLMTGPTNWPLVEDDDLWRPTPNGIRRMLEASHWFGEIVVASRGEIAVAGQKWCIGWEALARS